MRRGIDHCFPRRSNLIEDTITRFLGEQRVGENSQQGEDAAPRESKVGVDESPEEE